MPKLKTEHVQDDGWTRWLAPVMKGYKLGCCGCGLIHTMEFRVVKVASNGKNGTFKHDGPLNQVKYRVLFRARRHKRSKK